MKSTRRRTAREREAFAFHRMCRAIERLLAESPRDNHVQAVKWVNAWKELHAHCMFALKQCRQAPEAHRHEMTSQA